VRSLIGYVAAHFQQNVGTRLRYARHPPVDVSGQGRFVSERQLDK
jgi:hypothetical protein